MIWPVFGARQNSASRLPKPKYYRKCYGYFRPKVLKSTLSAPKPKPKFGRTLVPITKIFNQLPGTRLGITVGLVGAHNQAHDYFYLKTYVTCRLTANGSLPPGLWLCMCVIVGLVRCGGSPTPSSWLCMVTCRLTANGSLPPGLWLCMCVTVERVRCGGSPPPGSWLCMCVAVGLVGGDGSRPPGSSLCTLSPAGWLPREQDHLWPLCSITSTSSTVTFIRTKVAGSG